jgi:NADH-quinone oxidoreductase subunit L
LTHEEIPSALIWLALAVPGLPLISSLVCFLISKKFNWTIPLLSSILLIATTACSTILFFQLHNQSVIQSWPWLAIQNKIIHAGFLLDSTSLSMSLAVAWVSMLVHFFSIGYMAEDRAPDRYFGMLGFFTFAMLGLVMSSNLLITFFFWELVGFSSYRLIGHWYEKPAAANASTKAFLINRIGDLGFLIALMILWNWFGHLDINNFNFSAVPTEILTAAGLCIFIAVIGKSAQFPLLHWLPDAMEGPTPVSALIHAATMVAAGVFLLVRISPLFTESALLVISGIGAFTAVIGAVGALFQYDIKKILAYSTISQLGFMVMAIGAGAAQGGYLHLLHHAFFKAGLFLGAGAIIHALHQAAHQNKNNFDVQDIRNMGGLRKKLPVTFITFLIFGAALAGLPFTSGFVSKEIILSQMSLWAGSDVSGKWVIMIAAWVVTFLTPIYTFKLIWFVFFAERKQETELQEIPVIMKMPLIILSILSLALLIPNLDFHFFSTVNVLLNYFPEASISITIISLAVISFAIIFSYLHYRKSTLGKLSAFLSPQYYLDIVSDKVVFLLSILYTITNWIDKYIIDQIIHLFTYLQVTIAHLAGWTDRVFIDGAVNGAAYSAKGIGAVARIMINGKIQSYLLWAMAALLIFILWILY